MDALTQHACLAEVRQLWASAAHDLRPFTVWIAEHEPVPADADWPETPVVNAWLLNERGVEERAAADYVRFLTVHSGRLWSSSRYPLPAIGVFNNRPGSTHTIGLAAFAPILDSELVYLHYIWGGTFGRGSAYRLDPQAKTLECVRSMWIA